MTIVGSNVRNCKECKENGQNLTNFWFQVWDLLSEFSLESSFDFRKSEPRGVENGVALKMSIEFGVMIPDFDVKNIKNSNMENSKNQFETASYELNYWNCELRVKSYLNCELRVE